MAQRKKDLVKEGRLDKYGRKNDKTPADYLALLGADTHVHTHAQSSNSAAALSGLVSPPAGTTPAGELADLSVSLPFISTPFYTLITMVFPSCAYPTIFITPLPPPLVRIVGQKKER